MKITTFVNTTIASFTCLGILSSCAEVANNTALAGLAGAAGGALIGNSLGGNNQGRNAAIGAITGAFIGVLVAEIHKANEEQKAQSAREARRAISNQKVRSTKTKYVFVPVKNPDNGAKEWRIHDKKGAPVDDNTYKVNTSKVETGSVAEINGHKGTFYDAM